MRTKKSQAVWFRLICIMLAVSLPVALALRGAWMLSFRAVAQEKAEVDQFRTQELRTQSRALSDELWSAIHEVEIQSTAIDTLGKFPKSAAASSTKNLPRDSAHFTVLNSVENSIPLLVAEVSPSDLVVRRVISDNAAPASVQDLGFLVNSVSLRADLANAAKQISSKDIQRAGVSLVSFGTEHKYLAIAFPSKDLPTNVKVEPGMPVVPLLGKYIFAVINPSIAFKNIGKWASGREGEPLRGYLIGTDGRVLVHSSEAFIASDFSTSPIFRQALEPTFHGERSGGTGIYPAIDSLNTRVSYIQFHSLPYIVVAERVIRPNSVHFLRLLAGPAVLWGSVLALTCLASVLLISQVLAPEAPQVVAKAEAPKRKVPVTASPDLGRSLDGAIQNLAEMQNLKSSKRHLADEIRKLRELQKFETDEAFSTKISQTFENQLKSAEQKAVATAQKPPTKNT